MNITATITEELALLQVTFKELTGLEVCYFNYSFGLLKFSKYQATAEQVAEAESTPARSVGPITGYLRVWKERK